MDLGDAKLTIKAKDEATAKMQKIGQSTNNMSKKFKMAAVAMVAMGIALTAALTKMITSYAEAGDEVEKMSKRTGWGTVALSEMRYVAKIAGTELGSLEKGIKKLSKSIIDADRGLETYARSFRDLGLDIKRLREMSPEQIFWETTFALAELEDETLKAALAQEIFGRAGTELLPMLAMTREEIQALKDTAHDMGVVFDEEAAAAAARFSDTITTLKTALEGLKNSIAEQLMPQLEDLVVMFTEKVNVAMAWLDKHPQVLDAFVKLAGILAIGGVFYLAVLTIIKVLKQLAIAFAVVHAMSGPAGWAKLAIGGVIAAGAIGAISGLLGEETEGGRATTEARKIARDFCRENPNHPACIGVVGGKSMQFGGVVPGPIGQPVPITAHGGEVFAGVGGTLGDRNITVNVGNFMGDESALRAFTRKVGEVLGQDVRRTSFSGINRLEYFPGSSAP